MKLVVLVNGQRWEQTKYSKMALLTEFVASSMAQEMFTTLWKEKLTLTDENKWTYCKIRLFCLPTVRSQSFPSVDDVLKHFACLFLCSLRSQDTSHRPDREGGTVFVKSVELRKMHVEWFSPRCRPAYHLYHTNHTNPTKIPWRSHLDRWLGTLDSQAAKFTIEEIERGLVNQASSFGLNLLQQGLHFSFGENIKRFSFSHDSPCEIRRKKKLVKSKKSNLQEPEAVLQPSLAAGKVQCRSFYNVLL